MKNILFVASECVPFVKTGGLADVVGSLPKAFPKEKYDVRVILPKYMCIPEEYRNQMQYKLHFHMDLGSKYASIYVGVLEYIKDGITFYFIDNEHYFSGSAPYSKIGVDVEKYSYFSKAVLAALPVIGFQPDVIHCHDWQTSLIPVYLHTLFQTHGFYNNTKTILTIHNLQFQGIQSIAMVKKCTGLPDSVFTTDKMEFMKQANLLKCGMVYANFITTVSDTYAGEIQSPAYGEGLHTVLQYHNRKLRGIVNGIDYDEYNPQTDRAVYRTYSTEDFRVKKTENKLSLQAQLGLEMNNHKMLIGMVTRLTDQKGLNLLASVMDRLCSDSVQLVVLGTGDKHHEDMLRHFAWKYKGSVSANIYYSDMLAHKIYAASDAFLMPSRFEPCGLSQLISMRYGTVPILRETGGLRDTVEPYNEYENIGTGFSFKNYNPHEMLNTIQYAERIYFDKKKDWNLIAERGMKSDYSWRRSADKYMEIYDLL